MKQAFFNRTLGGNEQYSDYSFDELNYNYTSFPQAYNYDKDTDWVDAVTKHGWTHDHYLTLMGGGDRANYRLSAGYYDRTGTNLKQEYVRYSSRLQLDYNISDRIRASAEVQFTHSTNNKNYDDLLKIAYKKMPNMAIYEHDAQGNRTDRFFNITPGVGIGNTSGKFDSNQRNLMNPVALGYLAKHNVKGYRIIPKINLQYDIFDPSEIYLRLAGWVSIDLNHERTEKFLPAECVYNSAIDYTSANKGSTESVDKRNTSTEVSLTWQSRFYNPDMHRLQLQLKAQTSSSTESRQYIATQGLPSSEITSAVSKGRVVDTSNGNSTWHSVGWMGRMHYAFCNRYILDGNVRIDGSTQFGKDNRYGVFPGAAAKWLISDEPLFRKAFGTRVVTLLAPRISWGVSGRQPGRNYLQYSTLATNSYGYMDMSAVYPTHIRLDGLKWERVTSLNWGFDIELWDGLVSLNADFYKKRTKDLLFSNISIPSTSGFSTLTYKNVGSLDNYGWELTLNLYRFIKADKFSMDATFNLASNTNEIISLDPSVLNNYNNVENWGNGYYGARLQEGNSFGSIYGFRYKGVYSYSLSEIERAEAEGKSCAVARDGKGMVLTDADGKPKPMYYYYNSTKYQFRGGDAMYEDTNHDGSIDQYDVVYLGNCNPKLSGGWGLTFRYDKFSLNFFCNFRYGNKIINAARMNAENMYDAYNQCTTVNWRWRQEGDVTMVPRAVYQQGYNWLGSDRYVEDGSFMRLKYITARYMLPTELTKKVGIQKCSLYCTVTNLFCWTKYSGNDPEINANNVGVCIDNSITPRSKDWTVGLSVTF